MYEQCLQNIKKFFLDIVLYLVVMWFLFQVAWEHQILEFQIWTLAEQELVY